MNKIFKLKKNNYGQLLVEILVVIAISSILFPALLTGLVTARSGKAQQNQRIEAVGLLKEAEEAVRSVREKNWSEIAANGTFHPSITSSSWTLTAGTESLRGFTRSIMVADIYRDSNGVIVASGGTLDPSTKRVDSSVSWGTPYLSSVSSTTYLTRFNNTTYVQNTQAAFNQGTNNGTVVTNTGGGQVILGAGRGGSWCDPNLSIAALDLPKSGEALALTAIQGRAFAGTGLDASGVSFANIAISNAEPPVASINGTFDGYKTNAVFGEENYAYLATDTNSKEIVILDLNQIVSGKYVEVGYFNAPGNGDGLSIYVSGNTGYMTVGDMLYDYDLTSKTGSRPLRDPDGIQLIGPSQKIFAYGTYIYAVTDSSTTQLQIIDASDPTNLRIVGQAQLPSGSGKDVYINSSATRAYVATSSYVYIVDVSTKTGNRTIIGSFNPNGMSPNGITAATANKALVVGTGGKEYQVFDISDETNPEYCGGLDIDSGVNAVASVLESDGDAYSYILTHDATSELKIIAGGPGGQFSTSGTFVSSIFDASSSAAFNSFTPIFTQPPQTTIKFQVAVAAPVDNSCTNALYSFIGPDGTPGTYFTGAGAIPLITSGNYINPQRCFSYKAYLDTSEPSQTPVFKGMTVNYSL